MAETKEIQASWSSFFGGCVVLLLIFGGGIATFMHFSAREQAKIDRLQATLFEPYWNAIKKAEYEKAHSLRANEWQNENTVEALRLAYQKALKSHGPLVKTHIHVANRYYEPGDKRQTIRVESIYEFEDGWKGSVFFAVFRLEDDEPWRVGESSTPLSMGLGDGPY